MGNSNIVINCNQCEFCDEFAGGRANSFAVRYANEIASRTILEQDGFRAMPSIGQIVPGYLLLVPNYHYRAFADMSLEELNAAEGLKTGLTEQMRSTYGDCLFFEHGARTPDSGGCGISHAHLHIVPFPAEKDPVEELVRAFPVEEVSNLLDLKRIQPGKSYLYYESVRGERYVFYPPFIPSQYIRRLLAEALGIQTWDWRRCGREDRLLNTLSQTSRLRDVVWR
jgi:diadenosine tetraphosphate (Ap4A) HIT family hydrolase